MWICSVHNWHLRQSQEDFSSSQGTSWGVPGHFSSVNAEVLQVESGTGSCLGSGVAVRCSWCSAQSSLLHLPPAPPLCKQRCQLIPVLMTAPGLSGGAGEANCAIASPRGKFLPERAGMEFTSAWLFSLLIMNFYTGRQEGQNPPVCLCSALCPSQKPLPPRKSWETFWYFYLLIELRIELVWHISPNQKAQLFKDTQLWVMPSAVTKAEMLGAAHPVSECSQVGQIQAWRD